MVTPRKKSAPASTNANPAKVSSRPKAVTQKTASDGGKKSAASPAKAAAPAAGGRRKRKLKIYKNPNTGEVVETRGGNQKTLKAWKEEHGNDTVESWLVRVED